MFSRGATLMLNGEIGYANGYSGRQLPFFKNYYAGGIGSVRGYDSGSLGPIDLATGENLGGNRRLVSNAGLLFPLPGSGRTSRCVWAFCRCWAGVGHGFKDLAVRPAL